MSTTPLLSRDDILLGHSKAVIKLTKQLSALILKTVPELLEYGQPGWHAVGYRHPQAGHILSAFPLADSVKIYFEFGAYLTNHGGILSGNTTQTKQLTLHTFTELDTESFVKILREAVGFKTARAHP